MFSCIDKDFCIGCPYARLNTSSNKPRRIVPFYFLSVYGSDLLTKLFNVIKVRHIWYVIFFLFPHKRHTHTYLRFYIVDFFRSMFYQHILYDNRHVFSAFTLLYVFVNELYVSYRPFYVFLSFLVSVSDGHLSSIHVSYSLSLPFLLQVTWQEKIRI